MHSAGFQPETRPSVIHLQNRLLHTREDGKLHQDNKTFLHSDRTSCHTFQANHFRLFLHSAAYVLMHSLAAIGLRGTSWTNAQFNTLQIRLLKVAGRVCKLKTRIKFHLPTAFPLKHLYGKILYNLATGVT